VSLTESIGKVKVMKLRSKVIQESIYWSLTVLLAIAAGVLFYVSFRVLPAGWLRNLTQASGEACFVAFVVAILVEPRMLRKFGDEIAEQTFWSSFFSQALPTYRNAIRELAGESQFTIASHWRLTFDWEGDQHEVLKLAIQCDNHRQNRSTKPFAISKVYSSVFGSRRKPAEYQSYRISSDDPPSDVDLLLDDYVRTEHAPDGRLVVRADTKRPMFTIPANRRCTIHTEYIACVDNAGFYPLTVTRPTLSFTVQLKGTALQDLFLTITHPAGGTMRTLCEDIGTKLAKEGPIPVGGVFITGAALLISWKWAG
jgi:hypothetical protein